jgi:predicted nucleic acid-binding protein
MSGKCFVDADILVYAHDRSAGARHLRAQMLIEQLWDSGWGVVSTQVLEELCIHLGHRAANPLPDEEVRTLIRDYSTWEVVASTPTSIRQTLKIAAHSKLPFWDATILEAAERAGASILYSERLATGQRYGAIKIVNPLVEAVAGQITKKS